MEMSLSVPFQSAREAEIAYHALRVDAEPARSSVTKRLAVSDASLNVAFTARDARGLRVSVNSFLEHLVLVTETMEQFGPPVVK